MNSFELETRSPELVVAEDRLEEARKTSADIAGKIDKLRVIQTKLNSELGSLDMAWERRKFFEQHQTEFYAWASGESTKFPNSKALCTLEDDSRIMLLAFDHVSMRLLALDSASKLSESEELTNKARILQLRSQEEHLRAARALASVRQELGEDAAVAVENGRAQQLEAEADRITVQAGRLRRESEERLEKLHQVMREKGGQ